MVKWSYSLIKAIIINISITGLCSEWEDGHEQLCTKMSAIKDFAKNETHKKKTHHSFFVVAKSIFSIFRFKYYELWWMCEMTTFFYALMMAVETVKAATLYSFIRSMRSSSQAYVVYCVGQFVNYTFWQTSKSSLVAV